MNKRGRKPSKDRKGYFYEVEEKAVVDYINAETAEEKNRIFEQTLRPALTIMIESIIRRYKLFQKDEEFENTFDDAMTFIITKINMYKQDNGRAYSYIQTMCKNHLIAKLNESKKNTIRNISYDELLEDINDDEKFSYIMSYEEPEITTIISTTASEILTEIENDKNKLTKNEILVGRAVSEVLKNWEYMFTDFGSNKFNKSSILLYIKDVTNLPTKDIRNAMKKFKNIYFKTKENILV